MGGKSCMKNDRVVAMINRGSWQQKTKRNIHPKKPFQFGSASAGILIVAFLGLMAGMYLYSTNSTAVKGFEIRQVEKDIAELKKTQEQLRIKESEVKSLYHIEDSTKQLNMAGYQKISYIEEAGPVALRR